MGINHLSFVDHHHTNLSSHDSRIVFGNFLENKTGKQLAGQTFQNYKNICLFEGFCHSQLHTRNTSIISLKYTTKSQKALC